MNLGLSREEVAYKLGVNVKTVGNWERNQQEPIQKNRKLIRDILKMSIREFEGPITGTGENTYQSHLFTDSIKEHKGFDYLFDEINGIMNSWETPEDKETYLKEYGPDEKWKRLFVASSDTGAYFTDENGNVVAYWHFCFINYDLYKRGWLGENINVELDESELEPVLGPGDYRVYFVDFFPHPDFNNYGMRRQMLEAFVDRLASLALDGIFVRSMIANLSTLLVVRNAESLGFKIERNHSVHKMYDKHGNIVPTKVGELVLSTRSNLGIWNISPTLKKLYEKAEFQTKV